MAVLRAPSSDFDWGRKLGSGSFGVVYEVSRKHDGRTYAIKQMELAGMKQREQADVVNEVQLLASFDSPYIIRYFDSFIDGSVLNLVMEMAERGNLHDYIRNYQASRIPEANVWRFFLHTLLGVHHMHSKHILHRDIKSLNIFIVDVSSDGQDEGNIVAKLGDLGVAKVLSTQTNFAHTLVGTPYYLSPEMCEDKPYDAKSDVWATGVVLYELLSRRHPFSGDNQGALILNILRGRYPPPPSGYSDDVLDILKRCLTRDTKRRPNTAQLLANRKVRTAAERLGIDVPPLDALETETSATPVKKATKTRRATSTTDEKPPARVRTKKVGKGADAAANAPRKSKGQLLLRDNQKPKKLAPASGRPRSSRPKAAGSAEAEQEPPPASPPAPQPDANGAPVSPERACAVAAAAQAAAAAPGHSGTNGRNEGMVAVTGKLAFEFGESARIDDAREDETAADSSARAANAAAGSADDADAEGPPESAADGCAVDEEDAGMDENYDDDEFESDNDEEDDNDAPVSGDIDSTGTPDVNALTRRIRSLTGGLEGVVATARELVGEDKFAALYDLLRARAGSDPVETAPSSITDLSKDVFSIIPYTQAEAISMVYKALYLEGELSELQAQVAAAEGAT